MPFFSQKTIAGLMLAVAVVWGVGSCISAPHPDAVTSTGVDEKADGPVLIRGDAQPDWINGRSRRFLPEDFLIGVGLGPARPIAEDKARTEIAKIFYAEIEARSNSFEAYLQNSADPSAEAVSRIDIEHITRVSTQKTISGIRIVEIYAPQTDQEPFYALAVLDRRQTGTILKAKIRKLDQEIATLLDHARRAEDKFMRLKDTDAGLKKLILRESYDAELRIVNTDGSGIPAQINPAEVKRRLNGVLSADFPIALNITGNRTADIEQALTEAFNHQGFAVTENAKDAILQARGTIDITPMADSGDGQWQFVRWKLHIDLIDIEGGAVLGSVQESGKEGHLTHLQAEERAVTEIRKAVLGSMAGNLTNPLFSTEK